MYCLVGYDGKVKFHSWLEPTDAKQLKDHLPYFYDFSTRKTKRAFKIPAVPFCPKPKHDKAAEEFFAKLLGDTPAGLIKFLSHHGQCINFNKMEALTDLLTVSVRKKYFECQEIKNAEASYVEALSAIEDKLNADNKRIHIDYNNKRMREALVLSESKAKAFNELQNSVDCDQAKHIETLKLLTENYHKQLIEAFNTYNTDVEKNPFFSAGDITKSNEEIIAEIEKQNEKDHVDQWDNYLDKQNIAITEAEKIVAQIEKSHNENIKKINEDLLTATQKMKDNFYHARAMAIKELNCVHLLVWIDLFEDSKNRIKIWRK